MTRSKRGAHRAGALIAMLATIGSTMAGSGELGANRVGVDEFRFIEFDGRWWIVQIELSRDPGTVQLAR